jgi:hypothetical protein
MELEPAPPVVVQQGPLMPLSDVALLLEDLGALSASLVTALCLLFGVCCCLVVLKRRRDYARLAAADAEAGSTSRGRTGLYQLRAPSARPGVCHELLLACCFRSNRYRRTGPGWWGAPKSEEQHDTEEPPYVRMLGPEPKHVPDDLPPRLLLGITADGVREWLQEQGLLTPNATGHDAQAAANRASLADGLSLCERWQGSGAPPFSTPLHGHCVGPANVYVCWPLGAPLATLLEALESFIALPTDRTGAFVASGTEARDRSKIFFWICTFSLRLHSPPLAAAGCLPPAQQQQQQHGKQAQQAQQGQQLQQLPPPEEAEDEELSPEHAVYLEATALVIELVEHTLVLLDSWSSPSLFGRTHCLREVLLSSERRAKVEFAMGDADRRAFERAFGRDFDFLRGLLDRIAKVDLWQAACFSASDALYVQEEAMEFGYAPVERGWEEGGGGGGGGSGSGGGGGGTSSSGSGGNEPPQQHPSNHPPPRGAGHRGREAVNRQLHVVLRAALVRFARGAYARLSASGVKPAGASVQRLGALVKEADVDRLREAKGDRHPVTLRAINQLASVHMATGDLAVAERLYRECLQVRMPADKRSEGLWLLRVGTSCASRASALRVPLRSASLCFALCLSSHSPPPSLALLPFTGAARGPGARRAPHRGVHDQFGRPAL